MKKLRTKKSILKKVTFEILKNRRKNILYKLADIRHAYNDVKKIYLYNNYNLLNMFSYGNKKLSKNIMIFNLPSGITCKYNCKKCYTKKAERLYKNTRIQRIRNLFLILLCQHDNNFKKIIINYFNITLQKHALLYDNNAIMRIHESGDIFNIKYLHFLLNIIKSNKNIKFYTYTKKLSSSLIDKINNTYNNFNIVKSNFKIKNKNYVNYGHDEYINKLEIELNNNNIPYYICTYGQKNQLACGLECKKCTCCTHVLFHEH